MAVRMQKLYSKISYQDLMTRLDEIEKLEEQRTTGYRYNAGSLFKFVYAGYARVCEVVKPRHNPATGKIGHESIEFLDKWVYLTLLTEKTGFIRTVIVSRRKQGHLCDSLEEYAKKAPIGEPFFDVSYRWAELKFKHYFPFIKPGENIHLLRHWSATHFIEGHHTVEPPMIHQLAPLGGWDSLDTLWRTYAYIIPKQFRERI